MFIQQQNKNKKPVKKTDDGYEHLLQLAEEKSYSKKDNCFCGCGLAVNGDNSDELEKQTTSENTGITDNKPCYILPVMVGIAAILSLYIGYKKYLKK